MEAKQRMMRIVEKFLPKGETRYSISRPFRDGKDLRFIYATDTHVLVRVAAELLPADIHEDEGRKPSVIGIIDDDVVQKLKYGASTDFKSGVFMLCPTCKGTRQHQQADPLCEQCHGTGKITCEQCGHEKTCFSCYFRKIECNKCDGSGKHLERGKSVELVSITLENKVQFCRAQHVKLAREACGDSCRVGFYAYSDIVYFSNEDDSVVVAAMPIAKEMISEAAIAKAQGEG